MAKVIEISSHPRFREKSLLGDNIQRVLKKDGVLVATPWLDDEDLPPPPEPELQYAPEDTSYLDTLEQLEKRPKEDNKTMTGTPLEKKLAAELIKLNLEVARLVEENGNLRTELRLTREGNPTFSDLRLRIEALEEESAKLRKD